ncbi:MAG: hypothetical protein DSY42_02830 [Aquifex sp.]|nr:MAG: hypothetical protein DSY42_02830 [Aquifex sp.]
MVKQNFDLNPRNLLYKNIFDTLKSLLYDLGENEKFLLLKEENEKSVLYTLKGKPNVFIDLRLISDPYNPRRVFTLALITHIDVLFQATVDFYLTRSGNFVLMSWADKTPKVVQLIGNSLSLDQMVSIINHFKNLFKGTIKHRDNLLSILFKKAGVVDNRTYLHFIEEEIKIFGELQKFRFSICREQGKFKVLFDDIFSQNFTSVTNSIEKIATHITWKYLNGNYENTEWFQIFSFSPYIIVQQIELEPYIEEKRKKLFFKERKFKEYNSAKYIPVVSFDISKVKSLFYKFIDMYGILKD